MRSWRLYLCLFLIAFLLRGGVGTALMLRSGSADRLEFPDEEQYWLMARSFAAGQGLQDELGFRATRMPLFPMLLTAAAPFSNGILIAKAGLWIVGAAASPLTAFLACGLLNLSRVPGTGRSRGLTLDAPPLTVPLKGSRKGQAPAARPGLGIVYDGQRAGWIAGLLAAFDPFLIFFSSLLLTETLFLVALIALWIVAMPLLSGMPSSTSGTARWIAVGAVAAACVYTRESGVVVALVLLTAVVLAHRSQGRILAGAGLALAVTVLLLIPWAVRNRIVTGEWVLLTTRTGISLYDGVGPRATGSSDLGPIKQMPAVQGMNEHEWNRYFLRESFAAMRTDPLRILRLSAVKLARTWNPFPNVATYQSRAVRLVSAFWTLPVYVLALMGIVALWRRRYGDERISAVYLLIPFFCTLALHSVFVGSVRYRLAAMPFLEILAAYAIMFVMAKISSRFPGEPFNVGQGADQP
jgi:hypothetical protein